MRTITGAGVVLGVFLGISLAAAAATTSTTDPAGTRAAIEEANRKFMAAAATADAKALAELYAVDAQLLPPNTQFVDGRPAIQEFWKGAFSAGIKGATLVTIEVGGQGGTAYEVGRYTLLGEGGQPLDQGKYLTVWKKVGGTWKLYRDMWNTSLPLLPR